MKVPGKDQLHKNPNVHFEEHYTFHLFCTFLFLSNLVFKFSIVLIGTFWTIFTTIYLLFFLLINISYFSDLEAYSVPLRFIKPSKILIKQCFFEGFQLQNVLIMFLFFTKNAYLLTAKITLDVYNYLWYLHAVQELDDSLHVRPTFWWLIDVWLMQYVCVRSFFRTSHPQNILNLLF